MENSRACAGPKELSILMDLLSHDILNKNQATLSYIELIHWQPGDEGRTKNLAELAASQVKASSMLLDCVRRFVKATRGGEMPASPVVLTEMFALVAGDISAMFPFKRVTVDTSGLAPDAKVVGGQCVQDLFMNLTVNLVQLSPGGDVTLEVTGRRDDCGGAPRWRLTVTAKAAVMPQGVGESVFSRLDPADVSKMARVSGAAFAGSIARALGGALGYQAVDPEGGSGCVFDVSIEGAT